MQPIDLNVCPSNKNDVHLFKDMAKTLGFTGIATSFDVEQTESVQEEGFFLVRREEIATKQLNHLKKILNQIRNRSLLISLSLGGIDGLNWAASDGRIDLITLYGTSGSKSLRTTTAKLAAESGTFLEVVVAPLINVIGLVRSKMLKYYREAISIAKAVEMPVMISSGAKEPMHMRAPMALVYIGQMLGLDFQSARDAVFKLPHELLERNKRKISPDMIAPGVEVVRRSEN